MGVLLIPGYVVKQGSRLDRALLVKFMQRTYKELYPRQDFAHLAKTVDQYLAGDTQLWWVLPERDVDVEQSAQRTLLGKEPVPIGSPVGCLWLGNAIDQVQGDRHAYVFLLYVMPSERHQGIGSALMQRAEGWAKARGDRQIGLQVFQTNESAFALYQKLGYVPKSIWMTKSLV